MEFKILAENSYKPLRKITINLKWYKSPKGQYKRVICFTKFIHANGSLEAGNKALQEGLQTARE